MSTWRKRQEAKVADAEHDHFLRTWKGRLTEEAAKKFSKRTYFIEE